jgi:hypothetical protein
MWKVRFVDQKDPQQRIAEKSYPTEGECRLALRLMLDDRARHLADIEVVAPGQTLKGDAAIAWARR